MEGAIHNGQPLVKQTSVLLQPSKPSEEASTFISPFQVAIAFAIVAISILLIEYKKKIALWGWDILLMAVSGIIGLLLFVMIFSYHPSVSLNMIIFLFNPLALFLIPSVVKSIRRKQKHWWWTAWEVSIIIGFIGSFFQKIPVPILIVALFLLFNCVFQQWLIKNVYTATIENKAK